MINYAKVNYCNLIIKYFVTNFINKIFKVSLKQKTSEKISKNYSSKNSKKPIFDTFYTNIVFMSTFIPILFHVRGTKTRKFTWCDQESGQHGAGHGQAQLHHRKHSAPFSQIEAENSTAIGLLKKRKLVTN